MSEEAKKIGIGSTVFIRSNYSRDSSVFEAKICGETKRSWIISREVWHEPFKISKVGLDADGERWSGKLERDRKFQVFLSKEEVEVWKARRQAENEKWQWLSRHREDIGTLVRLCGDPAILKQIAALVGYKEKPDAE